MPTSTCTIVGSYDVSLSSSTAWHNDPTILLIQRGTVFGQRQFVPSDPYKHMVEHFATCVLKKTPLLYLAEDGWANLHVLDMLRGIENAL